MDIFCYILVDGKTNFGEPPFSHTIFWHFIHFMTKVSLCLKLTSRQKVACPKVFNLYCMLSELDKIKRSCCNLLLNDYEMSASLFRSGPFSLTVWSLTHNQQVCHLQVIICFFATKPIFKQFKEKVYSYPLKSPNP